MTADDRSEQLLTRLLGPADPEVSCEECFELLDEYVELELAGADADARIPGMRAHLAGLPRLPRGPREPARPRAPRARRKYGARAVAKSA